MFRIDSIDVLSNAVIALRDKCFHCGSNEKLYMQFGKLSCRKCIDQRKTGKKGHSGMVYKKLKGKQLLLWSEDQKIHLERCEKSNPLFVKWFIEHYPKSKGIVGRQINYMIYDKKEPIGIIGASSPPLNYKVFNSYFSIGGTGKDSKWFVNNNVYRIVKSGKNYGTQILKLFRNQLLKDYFIKYDTVLLGVVTFVEPPRNGSIYKADNWEYLGMTQGISVRRRGEDWFNKQYSPTEQKHIFGIKYKAKDYRRELGLKIKTTQEI